MEAAAWTAPTGTACVGIWIQCCARMPAGHARGTVLTTRQRNDDTTRLVETTRHDTTRAAVEKHRLLSCFELPWPASLWDVHSVASCSVVLRLDCAAREVCCAASLHELHAAEARARWSSVRWLADCCGWLCVVLAAGTTRSQGLCGDAPGRLRCGGLKYYVSKHSITKQVSRLGTIP